MRSESDTSAGPPVLTAIQRRRRRAAFVVALLAFLLWPLALRELAPPRLDTVRLGAISDAGGGQGAGHTARHRTRAGRPIVTAQGQTPSWQGFGLLGAAPPAPLGDLQNLPPTDPAVSADLPAFGAPASDIAAFNPASFPQGSGPQGFGPGGPFVTTPGGPPSPTLPVISQPPIDPPITTPDNPVTTPDPSGPPPVVPPGNPPELTPLVAPPVGPEGPNPANPLLPDPGGPRDSEPRGDPPASVVPEPGVWMNLLLGAALAGAALRHARRARPCPAWLDSSQTG